MSALKNFFLTTVQLCFAGTLLAIWLGSSYFAGTLTALGLISLLLYGLMAVLD